MIIDRYNEFSDSQAVTASAASTDVVDLLAAGNMEAKPEFLHIKVQEAATAAGAATVTFALQTDDNSGFSSATTLYTTAAVGKATLVAGYEVARVSLAGLPLERYLRVYYTVATGPLTAGEFDAFLSRDADTNEFKG